MAGTSPRIHGDGEQTRDFTYIDDVVDATLLAAFSAKAEGQFTRRTGRETTGNQLARIIIEITGAQVEPAYATRREMTTFAVACSTSKDSPRAAMGAFCDGRAGLRRTYLVDDHTKGKTS